MTATTQITQNNEADDQQNRHGPALQSCQPWLHDMHPLIAAPAQLWCDAEGSVRSGGVTGFYVADTRIIDAMRLTVNGEEPQVVAWRRTSTGSGRRTLLARNIICRTVDPQLRIDETSTVQTDGLRRHLTVSSGLDEELSITVAFVMRIDMSAMQRIKGGADSGRPAADLRCERHGRRLSIRAASTSITIRTSQDIEMNGDEGECNLVWRTTVPAGADVSCDMDIRVASPANVVVAASPPCPWDGLRLESSDPRLQAWVQRSLEDLAGLRMSIPSMPDDVFLAAGAPWFFTLFGRDSIWAARFLLPLGTETAMGTLRTLAHFQAMQDDKATAANPGKIPHELRADPLVAQGAFASDLISLPPLYYGTIDATPLWVILLAESLRRGADRQAVRLLLPNLRAALEWLVRGGDPDGDGFLEYIDETGHGLSNQGWKDSGDSIRWRDGRIAEGPIALCEVQGYAYEAATLGAWLLDEFQEPGAQRYREWAAQIRKRFNERFWVSDEHGRYPAIALDGQKRPVDSVTSNIGHLLGTGILDARGENDVVNRLMSKELFSGFGIRTLSTNSKAYWPLSYHCGSVWAHDSAIALMGMHERGYDRQAHMLAEALIRAAQRFDYQIPELYSGDGDPDGPIPYPAACHPQAWSAAASMVVYSVIEGVPVPHSRSHKFNRSMSAR